MTPQRPPPVFLSAAVVLMCRDAAAAHAVDQALGVEATAALWTVNEVTAINLFHRCAQRQCASSSTKPVVG